MLKILRKKGVSKKILWVLAFMITVSFVFWGMASSLQKSQGYDYAGKIFGHRVSFEEFQNAFMHVRNQAILRYGDNFFKIQQFLNLNDETWDRLILLHEGKKRHIKISNEAIVETISGLPFFQRDGRFDPALYNQIVQYVFRCRPRDFEEGVRGSLVFQKIYEEETSFLDVSDKEALEEYKNRNEKTQVDYVLFSTTDFFSKISITDEDAQKYFENNKDRFLSPLSINVQYLALEYPKEATEEQKKETEDKALSISKDLQENISLEDIAEKYNLSLKESGFFNREQPKMDLGWPLEVLQASLSLPKDKAIGPLPSSKGYYVLRLKEKKDSYIPEFSEAKERVEAALKEKEAKTLAEKEATKTLEVLKGEPSLVDQKDFQAACKKLNLKVEESPEFTRGQYLENLGLSPRLYEEAFSLSKENPLSNVAETASGYIILHFMKFVPIDEEKFKEEKDELKNELLSRKKDEAFNIFLAELRQEANLQDNLKKLEKPSPEENN